MKHLRKIFVLIICVLLMTGAAAPAVHATAEQIEITDFFGPGCFSDDTANRMLSLIPQICRSLGVMEISSYLEKDAEQSISTSVGTIRYDLSLYADGENETAALDALFASEGIYIYPDTLGNYLYDKGYPEIGSALAAAGRDWTVFTDENDDHGFDFDWGIDEKTSLEEKYDRFITVAGDLLGACRPVFDALFGFAAQIVEFNDKPFCNAVMSNLRLGKLSVIKGEVATATWNNFSMTFEPAGFYDAYIRPLYNMLGAGVVVPCSIPGWNNGIPGQAAAEALFAPLYAIVEKVGSDPDTCRRLIDYYHSHGPAQYIPSEEFGINGTIALSGCEVEINCENKLFKSVLNSVKSMAEETLDQVVPCSMSVTLSDDGMNASVIYETLQNLVYTEPEVPAVPEEPTQEPEETGTQDNAATSLIDVIRGFFEGILNFFRKLFG
ncbi:MAG: hypothetical protein K6G90_02600 [Clostridia bacterium]|nr:hypothetical protein [Clostridia bacterium]